MLYIHLVRVRVIKRDYITLKLNGDYTTHLAIGFKEREEREGLTKEQEGE